MHLGGDDAGGVVSQRIDTVHENPEVGHEIGRLHDTSVGDHEGGEGTDQRGDFRQSSNGQVSERLDEEEELNAEHEDSSLLERGLDTADGVIERGEK